MCDFISFVLFVSSLFMHDLKITISMMAVSGLFEIAAAINHYADKKDQSK